MNDEDFKQACIDKSFSESCKKDLDHYIELANQAKKAVSKYFERKDIELQAYYTGANDADRVLNINLTNHDGNGPIRIGDILQQEKNISELNVYCNKKHDICAYRKNKERHYKFKEGAYYEMTSTWPIKDEYGKVVSTCIMVMNVSSDGIAEILRFNSRSFTASDEVLGLIEKNHELYIQDLSLYDAVKALLERNKNAPLPDVVPTANNNPQNNESIRVDQDKKLDRQGLENNADNSPIFPTNSDASTQTEGNLQQGATQVEIHSQPIATQQEVNDLQRKLEKERQKNVELEKYNNDLQNKFRKEEQKNIELQASLAQKDEELANTSVNLQGKTQELEGAYKENEDLKKKMENLQVEKNKIHEESRKEVEKLNEKIEAMKQKIERLEGRSSDLQSKLEKEKQKNVELKKHNKEDLEKIYRLEDENDQLKCSNKKLEKETEQLWQKILVLKEVSLSLEVEKQELSNRLSNSVEKQIKLEQELIKARQEIEKLGKENNSLQAEHEEKEQKLKKKIGKMFKKIIQSNEKLKQEVQELYKENEELKTKLKLISVEYRKLEDKLEKTERAE
ncbi:MAG: hypothetical protein KTV72_04670, partial [Wolbachia endosymbiont of Melophagus ovinus]|nr:hypothetical protein [Wolbachia endosymbiont of Melophagus ovinus]